MRDERLYPVQKWVLSYGLSTVSQMGHEFDQFWNFQTGGWTRRNMANGRAFSTESRDEVNGTAHNFGGRIFVSKMHKPAA